MALPLAPFGRESLETSAIALDVPVESIVRQATLYYLAERDYGRSAWKVPRFLRDGAADRPGRTLDIPLEFEEADWGALEAAAGEQDVALAQLVEHAVLLFLADVNSGRVAVQILEE